MKTIHHVSGTTAPRDTIFAALTTTQGLSGWRATIVTAEAGAGAIVHVTFAGDVNPDMRVTALEPPALVCWECAGGHEPRFTEEFKNRNNSAVAGTRPARRDANRNSGHVRMLSRPAR